MKFGLTLIIFLFSTICFGQAFVFDTTYTLGQNQKKDYYYSKTDFSFSDTLKLWNYLLDTNYHPSRTDSINPIGQLHFWRTNPIDDSISKIVYNRLWTPQITFDVYTVADLNYCYKRSLRTRFFSSCVPPDVGGDIIIIDKFVFVSRGVCISCSRYNTGKDYCRPIINYLFSNLDKSMITTIQSLVRQFTINEGILEKRIE